MFINIRTVCGLLPDELAEKLNMLEYPAVLLDKDLKVVSKNNEANGFARFLRKGAKISRFLPEGDETKVKNMISGDTLVSSISANGISFRVNIIHGFDCYLVILHAESAGLRDGVASKYMRMSGYDVDITEPEKPSKQPKMPIGLERIIENALLKHSSPHSLPFFNSAAIIKGLTNELQKANKTLSDRIKCSVAENELISEGNEKDFILILAFMISLCLDFSEDDIFLEAKNEKDELVFRVSSNVDASVYGVARLASLSKGFGNSENGFEESDFYAYLLKLLSDGNLWDFSIDCHSGKLNFTLRTPYVRSGEEFMVRDISAEFIINVVKELLNLIEAKTE
ncbi:MAG: hypothetical protein J6Q89_07825 [Clostridia bacterium]|nr:hypothetical protein [Clostridia bacterium]